MTQRPTKKTPANTHSNVMNTSRFGQSSNNYDLEYRNTSGIHFQSDSGFNNFNQRSNNSFQNQGQSNFSDRNNYRESNNAPSHGNDHQQSSSSSQPNQMYRDVRLDKWNIKYDDNNMLAEDFNFPNINSSRRKPIYFK